MDVYQWTLAARQDLDSYLAIAGTSLPYNLAHAIGNVGFCLLIGPAFVRALRPLPAPLRGALAGAGRSRGGRAACWLVLAVPAARPPRRRPPRKAERYLRGAQNRDGGFGSAPGQSSNALFTGWAALGLAVGAARTRATCSARSGRSLAAYVARTRRAERDIGEVERTVLVLRAAGLSPRRFGGRDLVAEIRAAGAATARSRAT